MKMLFLIFWATVVSGKPCGTPLLCKCELDMGIVSCYGSHISEILFFSDEMKSNILFLDIYNTNITEIPSLQTWPSLLWLTLQGNPYLPCTVDVVCIDYLDSDCSVGPVIYNDANEDFSGQSELFQMVYALIVIPFGSLSCFWLYLLHQKKTGITLH